MRKRMQVVVGAISISLVLAISGCVSIQSHERETISTARSIDGSPITYGVRGRGEITLVFVHCWTCNHEFWRPQVEYFSKSHKVVWLDLAGHGLSGSNRSTYSMSAFGQDVAAVVNKIGGTKVILVGHSMGGPVSIEATRILGDKVAAVVGVDTFYTPFRYPKSDVEIENFVKPFKDNFKGTSEKLVRSMFTPDADKELIDSIVNQLSGADQEMAVSAMYEIFRWNAENVPSILNKYAEILHNVNGAPAGKEKASHESVVLIPGVGHFVAQVKAREFNAVLGEIIAEYQK